MKNKFILLLMFILFNGFTTFGQVTEVLGSSFGSFYEKWENDCQRFDLFLWCCPLWELKMIWIKVNLKYLILMEVMS